jgi:hypothetical protein
MQQGQFDAGKGGETQGCQVCKGFVKSVMVFQISVISQNCERVQKIEKWC